MGGGVVVLISLPRSTVAAAARSCGRSQQRETISCSAPIPTASRGRAAARSISSPSTSRQYTSQNTQARTHLFCQWQAWRQDPRNGT
eukprot:1439977-Pyramimonas_sp.AAC.1